MGFIFIRFIFVTVYHNIVNMTFVFDTSSNPPTIIQHIIFRSLLILTINFRLENDTSWFHESTRGQRKVLESCI